MLRWKIFKRDNFTCQYCGQYAPNVQLEVDHKLEVANGGDDSEGNLITSCWSCNHGKEALRQLMIKDQVKREKVKPAQRQSQLLELLTQNPEGLTTIQIMERLNIKRGNTDMTLLRLKEKGKIRRTNNLLFVNEEV